MGAQDLHQKHCDLLEIKRKCIKNSSRNLLWNKVMEAKAKGTWLGSWIQKMEAKGGQKQHSNSGIMKLRRKNNTALKMIKRKRARRAGQEGSRRCTMIEKKVRTLKKLIPNAGSSVGLDGLFRETAEYISNLEMRVKIMQAVVNALSKS
ncbi:putative transcription factor bHLH family [Helianthus annuus]|uniref:Transcription factor bHLH family n=2 Tax=Helianthus annuus TaxID=4232 RepID=A0A9K3DWQ4_HELAN|nr:transcription factor UPBEAT1 [Helianthus annuus]KAF5762809.1 putative transcription factor bHLH family [Helianthus annuus]KAJ0651052.1 putative transcription factor bHLH family [Helianthus annuus]KAJ0829629.1 putative transcription factor bHLH family [Helianthus annuus]